MRFDNASVLFFLLASGALLTLELLRHRAPQPRSGDRYAELAALAGALEQPAHEIDESSGLVSSFLGP